MVEVQNKFREKDRRQRCCLEGSDDSLPYGITELREESYERFVTTL